MILYKFRCPKCNSSTSVNTRYMQMCSHCGSVMAMDLLCEVVSHDPIDGTVSLVEVVERDPQKTGLVEHEETTNN